jgi:ATP-binding cassette subfamily F protein 3
VKIKKNMTIGYLDQSGLELNNENDVIDEARSVASDMSIEKARSALGRFLFSKNDVFKKVADLSGGERNRLALCKLVLAKPEILLLDEPTNHLDIPSIEALENALGNYIGTVIVVSHDRFFIDRVADKLLVIGADRMGRKAIGQHEIINGSFSRYREILENRDSQKQSKSASTKTKPKRPKKDSVKGPAPIELKKFNTWPAKKIEAAIEETEVKIESKKEKFTLEEIYTDHKKLLKLQAEVDKLSKYLDVLYRAYEWKLQ